jgi:hypothetical protein
LSHHSEIQSYMWVSAYAPFRLLHIILHVVSHIDRDKNISGLLVFL